MVRPYRIDQKQNVFPKGLGLGTFLDGRYAENFKEECEVQITEPNLTPKIIPCLLSKMIGRIAPGRLSGAEVALPASSSLLPVWTCPL